MDAVEWMRLSEKLRVLGPQLSPVMTGKAIAWHVNAGEAYMWGWISCMCKEGLLIYGNVVEAS